MHAHHPTQANAQMRAYRAFRRAVLTASPYDPHAWLVFDTPLHESSDARRHGRRIIRHFRQTLVRGISHWWQRDPASFRRALGLPDAYDGRVRPLFRRPPVFWQFLPRHLVLRRLFKRMPPIRVLEGRALWLDQAMARPDRTTEVSLDGAVDFVMRRLPGTLTEQRIRTAHRLDLPRLRVAYQLGVRTMDQLDAHASRLDSVPLGFLSAWTRTGLLRGWLDLETRRPTLLAYRAGTLRDDDFTGGYYPLLHQLQRAGVSDDVLRRLHHENLRFYHDPSELRAVIDLVVSRGIDLEAAVVLLRDQLWGGTRRGWDFVLTHIGAPDLAACVPFARLLTTDDPPRSTLVRDLKDRGAGLEVLAMWLPWIEGTNSRHPDVSGVHLDALLSAGLALEQIALCPDYTTSGFRAEGPQFLTSAAAAGASCGDDLVAVYPAYAELMRYQWSEMLPMRESFGSPPLSEWTSFLVTYGHAGGRSATLRYLHEHYGVNNLDRAARLVQLGRLDPHLVAYQQCQRKRKTIASLSKWYYERGWGAHTVVLDQGRLPFQYRVLDEIERRNNYYAVAGILRTLDLAVARACASCGADFEAVAARVEPLLPEIFQASGGVVLPSIVDDALSASPDLTTARERIDAAMVDILKGSASDGAPMSAWAMEALCYVFQVSESDVTPLWSRLCGHESHLDAIAPADARVSPMIWTRRTRTLATQPPPSQVLALRQAAAWARMWAVDAERPVGEAGPSAPSDPTRLRAREASLETTSAYLALLLALVGQDRTMQPLIARVENVFAEPAELPADLELLTELLYERLPLAVRHASTRPARPPALAQAAHQALGVRDRTLDGAELAHQLYETLAKVLGRFLDQLGREEVFQMHGEAPLQAILTKAPAAFFARMAVGLCTDQDAKMWEESRHAHVVILSTLR